MKWIIISELVGTPGDEFIPGEGINTDALVWGGFIVPDTSESAKTEDNKES